MSDTEVVPEDSENKYACNDCNSTFQEATEFHNHSCNNVPVEDSFETKGRRGLFKCEICCKSYKQKRYLAQHIQLHKDTLDFTCNLCQKQFKTKVRLQCHYQTHTSRYVCPVCKKGFGESGNLKKHLRIHSGERPFVCDICNKAFTQKRHLQDHKSTHTGELDHPCDICGKKFLTKRTLKVHKFCHGTELPFGCKECNASFAQYSSLKIHLCSHTQDRPYYCNVCGKGFKRHYDLRAHLTVHTGEQPYTCEVCQRSFHKFAILKIHMESHTDERNFVCHLCNKAFKTFNVLKKHCLLHTGERNKTCKICNKSFKCNNTLRTHYLTHSDERPFVCEICGKTFKRITPLQNHLTTHTGELPYPCEVCGKRFARKSTLENHFILHTGERPYVCPICQRSFTRKSSLKIHHTTVHTKDTEPENLDNKAQHLVAGDLARHAILASHVFDPKPDTEKNTTSDKDNQRLSSESGNSNEGDVTENDAANKTDILKEKEEVSEFSTDEQKNSNAVDIEMEFSDSKSMDSVYPSNPENEKKSKKKAPRLKAYRGEVSFHCDICGKTFARKSTLQNHFILHTGKKPYACPMCEKSFTRKNSLKIHLANVHTKDKPLMLEKIQPLAAGDKARHALLAPHRFDPKPKTTKIMIDKVTVRGTNSVAGNSDQSNVNKNIKSKTDCLKDGHNGTFESSANGKYGSSNASDIEMEFSHCESMNSVQSSNQENEKFSCKLDSLSKENIVNSEIDVGIFEGKAVEGKITHVKPVVSVTDSSKNCDIDKTLPLTVEDIIKIEPLSVDEIDF